MSARGRCDPRRVPSSTAWTIPTAGDPAPGRPPASDSRVAPGGPVVPRSFTSTTPIPASSALSDRQASRWVRRQLRSDAARERLVGECCPCSAGRLVRPLRDGLLLGCTLSPLRRDGLLLGCVLCLL